MAYSADGKSFTRHTPGLNNKPGLVLTANAPLFGAGLPGTFGDGVVADPDVVYKDGLFHVWFSSYAETVPNPVGPTGHTALAFGISHAASTDGINWNFNHGNPLPSLRRPAQIAGGQQPSVLFNNATDQYEMWLTNDTEDEARAIPCNAFQAAGFWHAVSNDGLAWIPDYAERHFKWNPAIGYESLGLLTGVKVAQVDANTYRAYYSAWGDQNIPDPAIYACPDQQGNPIPALVTLNTATYTRP